MTTTQQPNEGFYIHPPVNYVGIFTIIHKDGITKFNILDLAIRFFQTLPGDATLWDVTDGYVLLKWRTEIEMLNAEC
jgi:hypothetical protein